MATRLGNTAVQRRAKSFSSCVGGWSVSVRRTQASSTSLTIAAAGSRAPKRVGRAKVWRAQKGARLWFAKARATVPSDR